MRLAIGKFYYKIKNLNSDTDMRNSISKTSDKTKKENK